MIGLIKSEILKLRHRPILYISFALVIFAVAAFSAVAFIKCQRIVEEFAPPKPGEIQATILGQLSYINILVIILMIVISTTMFTSEFSYGTISQILIYPQKLYKIILSKLTVIIGLTIVLQAVLYGVSILAAALFDLTSANTFHMLFISGNAIYLLDFYFYLFLKYLCYFGQFLFYLSIVMFFALITKKAAATIGITVPLLLIVTPVLQFINQMIPKLKLWVVPFNTANFVQYLDMNYAFPGYDLPWAIVITAATMAVLSFFGFRRFRRINI